VPSAPPHSLPDSDEVVELKVSLIARDRRIAELEAKVRQQADYIALLKQRAAQ
jgi:hypothetical protein